MNKKYKILIKNVFIFAIGGMGSKLILFFLVPLYTNFLTTEEYGIADLIFTISQLLIPFLSITIFDSVLRFSLSKDEKRENVLLCGYIVFGVGVILTIFLAPLLNLYATIAKWKWYLCVYIILSIVSNIQLNYIKAKEKNTLYSIISVTQTFVMALTNVILLVFFRLGIEGYILANIISMIVSVIGTFVFGKLWEDIKVAEFSLLLLKKMAIYSTPLIMNNISWWVIHSSDKFMIELMIGASALGIYTVATKIPSFLNVIVSIFSQAWSISSVKEVEGEGDKDFYLQVFNIYTLIAFGFAIAVISIIKPFMQIYVGVDFLAAWKFVPLLLVSAVFSAISSYFGTMAGALKRSFSASIFTFIASIVNILVNLLLIPKIGVMGAVIGTLLSYVVVAVLRMFGVLHYVKFNISWNKFICNFLIITTQAILVPMDILGWLVSIIAIGLFLVVNFSTLKGFLKKKA